MPDPIPDSAVEAAVKRLKPNDYYDDKDFVDIATAVLEAALPELIRPWREALRDLLGEYAPAHIPWAEGQRDGGKCSLCSHPWPCPVAHAKTLLAQSEEVKGIL